MSERTQQFKQELINLCRKYDCEIEARDHWTGYAECGQDVRITVEFNGDYSAEIPFESLDLASYIDGNTKID